MDLGSVNRFGEDKFIISTIGSNKQEKYCQSHLSCYTIYIESRKTTNTPWLSILCLLNLSEAKQTLSFTVYSPSS